MLKTEIRALCRAPWFFPLPLLLIVCALAGVHSLSSADLFAIRHVHNSIPLAAMGLARQSAIILGLFFGFLTPLLLARDTLSHTSPVLDAYVRPSRLFLARLLSLLLCAVASCVLLFILSRLMFLILGTSGDDAPLALAIALVTLPTVLISILLGAGLYGLTNQIDVTMLCIAALVLVGLLGRDYRLNWVTTSIALFSDFAGVSVVAWPMLYSRLIALALSLFVFLAGLLARRLRDRAAFHDRRGRGLPAACAVALLVGVSLCAYEPFLERYSPLLAEPEEEPGHGIADDPEIARTGALHLEAVQCDVSIQPGRGTLSGAANYDLRSHAGNAVDFHLNSGLTVDAVSVDGAAADFHLETGKLRVEAPPGAGRISVRWHGRIRTLSLQAFPGYIDSDSVYLQETACWLPQPAAEITEPFRLTGSVRLPMQMTAVVPGVLTGKTQEGTDMVWQYEMTAAALDVALFAGDYERIDFDADGVPVELYVSRLHADPARAFGIVAYTADILTHYQNTVGEYPYDVPMKIVENAIYKAGGHSSLNILSVAESAFNRDALDRARVMGEGFTLQDAASLNQLSLLAHELAHQWFGSGVRCTAEGAWSSEGMAQYLSASWLAHAFSPQVAGTISVYAWINAIDEEKEHFDRDPVIAQKLSPAARAQAELRAQGVAYYQEMPARILAVRKQIGGAAFDARLRALYRARLGQTLSLSEFLQAMGVTQEVVPLDFSICDAL